MFKMIKQNLRVANTYTWRSENNHNCKHRSKVRNLQQMLTKINQHMLKNADTFTKKKQKQNAGRFGMKLKQTTRLLSCAKSSTFLIRNQN